MKNKKSRFNKVRVLTTASMLTALSIIIGIFCKNFLNFGTGLFRITFENFPIILSGIMFGPLVGSLVGVASDVLSYILSTQSFAISPIVTLGAALVGCVSGFVSHYIFRKNGTIRIVMSVIAAHLMGSVIVKSAGLFVYYGWLIVWRIPLYTVIAFLEIILVCLIYKNKNGHHLQ
jgi:ECF transporter S component (folate family)